MVQKGRRGKRQSPALRKTKEGAGTDRTVVFRKLQQCNTLKAEINDLERKRQEAERRADEYQRYGDEELERERQERLRRIRESLSKA